MKSKYCTGRLERPKREYSGDYVAWYRVDNERKLLVERSGKLYINPDLYFVMLKTPKSIFRFSIKKGEDIINKLVGLGDSLENKI